MEYKESDVFLWANNLVPIKEQLEVELYLFNRNYVVYRANYNQELVKQLQPIFIDPMLEYVLGGIDEGLLVRGFEDAEGEENVLQRTKLARVEHACEVINWIENEEFAIESFVEEEHDFKRIKGILLRVKHKSLAKPFYIVKQLGSAQVMKAGGSWMMRQNRFTHFDADAAIKVSADNHVLILEQDIYAFNQSKFVSLFGYDAKKQSIADKKMTEIEARFSLSFDGDMDLQTLIKDKKVTINKLQKLEIGEELTQAAIIDQAEEMGLDLMTDDNGAIIIMTSKDLDIFVNLLNDDYHESSMTGKKYEIKSKRELKPPKDDQ